MSQSKYQASDILGLEISNLNDPYILYCMILPLSDHHSHFWAATFDIHFFHAAFFDWAAPFLQFGYF